MSGDFERGHFIKQLDSFNYGPIACIKILEMFHLTSDYEVRLAYAINGIRNLVADEWRKFIIHTTIATGPRSACERASYITHTSC